MRRNNAGVMGLWCAGMLWAAGTPSATAQCVGGDRVEPPTIAADQEYGSAIAVTESYLFVGSPRDDTGTVSVFDRVGDDWVFSTTLTGSDSVTGDRFGSSVAADENFVVIGAPGADSNGSEGGKAYVFKKGAFGWSENALLVAEIPRPTAQFGFSADMDGDRLVVGAPFDDTFTTDNGLAYVFERAGGGWTRTATLNASTPGFGHDFGWSVDLDGDRLAIGEPGAARATILDLVSGVWTNTQELLGAFFDAGFGRSVALEDDKLVIGVPFRDLAATNDGVAYVYGWDGVVWTREETLAPSPSGVNYYFANRLRLDEGVLAVGTEGYDAFNGDVTGSVYVYRLANGAFRNVQVLVPSTATVGDQFGVGIATHDGEVLVGGPFAEDATGTITSGAAFSFDLSEITLSTSIPDPGPGDTFDLVAGCGPSGTPVALFLREIDGSPFILNLFVSTFDANSELRLPVNPAPNLGFSVTLQVYAFNVLSELVESNTVTLDL